MFSSMIGGVVILTVLLLATHVLLALQRRTIVTAVAFDVARSMARNGGIEPGDGERRVRELLHDDHAVVEWLSVVDDDVELRITTRSPSLIAVGPLAGLARIERTVHVRGELLRTARP
jgi:hypothetical protein